MPISIDGGHVLPLDATKLVEPSYGAHTLPVGWLSDFDSAVLYTSALRVEGPVLEVGSWAGRSTCSIAYALRERAKAGPKPRFDVVDFGVAGLEEWTERFGDNPLTRRSAAQILEVIMFPGGTIGKLKSGLVERGLSLFVDSIFLGDLLEYRSNHLYHMIFCDVSHDTAEIERHVNCLKAYADAEDHMAIFDDVVDEACAQTIMRIWGASTGYLTRWAQPYSKMLMIASGRYATLW